MKNTQNNHRAETYKARALRRLYAYGDRVPTEIVIDTEAAARGAEMLRLLGIK
jgi:hypothetical protein